MGVSVENSVEIDRDAETVAAYAMDPDNAPEWYVNIKSAEWQTERPLRIGSRIAFVASFLGRRLAYTYEIVELDPGRRLVMRTAEGPFPMRTTYDFRESAPGRTVMRLANDGEPSGFSRLMAPFMEMAMTRANRKDLALLKSILERPA